MSALEYLLQFPWVEPLGRALLHFLWQGLIVGLLAAAVMRNFRAASPARRHAVAAGALLICAVLPVATFASLVAHRAPAVPMAVRLEVSAPPQTVPLAPIPEPSPVPAAISNPAPAQAAPAAPRPAPVSEARLSITRLAVCLWIAGVLLLGLRFALGWLRVQLWRGGAEPLTSGVVGARFTALAARLGLAPGRARLLLSRATSLSSPVVAGIVRPVVLLPAWVLENLPLDRIEALLAHELAHLRRYDYLWNLLTSALEVALFYHPAIWYLSRALRTAAEEACDDVAASVCPSPVEYARALASLAECAAVSTALAAAERPLLARVRRLVGLPHAPVRRPRNTGWVLALASVVLAAAGIFHSGEAMAQSADDEADPTVPTVLQHPLRGQVLDPAGQPVANARVRILYTRSSWSPANRVVEETRTGAGGRYAFTKEFRYHFPDAVWDPAEYTLLADVPGLAPAWSVLAAEDAGLIERPLTLTKPARQTFRIRDRAGQPCPGARVRLQSAYRHDTPPALRDNLVLTQPLGFCEAVTDAKGEATLENLPDTELAFTATCDGYGEAWLGGSRPRPEPLTISLQAASTLSGRVTDPLGQPVAGAVVSLYPKFNYHQFFEGKTDADGHYRIEKIWSDHEANRDTPKWGAYQVAVRHPALTATARDVTFATGQEIAGFDLRAEPGTELRGRLLDPVTKAPVLNAGVQVDSPSGRQSFRTGFDGVFHGRVMPGKIYVFNWGTPRHAFYLEERSRDGFPSTIDTEAAGETQNLELYLPGPLGALGTVRGEVKYADGRPAPLCRITPVIAGDRLQTGGWTGNELHYVMTDAQGAFALADIPIGPDFTLVARTSDRDGNGSATGHLTAASPQTSATILLQKTVSGDELLITDLGGHPRANLPVNVQQVVNGEALWVQHDPFSTDANGVLHLAHVLPGLPYRLSTVGGGWENEGSNDYTTPAAGAPAPAARPALTLDREGAVRLLDPAGHPLSIKRIVLFDVRTVLKGEATHWRNDLPVTGHAGTDARIPWHKVVGHRGDVANFLIETDDGTVARGEGRLPDDGTNLIVVRAGELAGHDTQPDATVPDPRPGWFAGRVVTPEGQPIAGASVQMPGVWIGQTAAPVIITDAEGLFRVAVPPYNFTYLTIGKESWATAFLTDVPEGSGFRVTLRRDGGLRGKAGGAAESRVTFLMMKNKYSARETYQHEIQNLQLSFATDEHGAYDLPVEPGHYRWQAASADRQRFARGEIDVAARQWVDLGAVLAEGFGVTFEMADVDTHQPVPGVEVTIFEQQPDRTWAARPGSAKTSDAAGRIRWENLPPGEKEFTSYRMRGGNAQEPQFPWTRWWRVDEPVQWRRVDYAKGRPTLDSGAQHIYVDVEPNLPPVRLQLERGVKLSGQVLAPDGQPAKDVQIMAVTRHGSLSNFRTRPEEDGSFLFYLPAGNGVPYHLCAFTWPENDAATGATAVTAAFESKPGDERTFLLRQSKGGWLTGRVVAAPGANLPAELRITARAGDGLECAYAARIAKVGSDGRYRLGPLRAGRYEVYCGRGAGAPVSQMEGTPTAPAEIKSDGETVEQPDLVLPANVK